MRIIILALLLASQAHAQGVCTGHSATGPATLTESPPGALTDVPTWAGGACQGYGQRLTFKGGVAWQWCPKADGSWALQWGARTASELLVQLPQIATALLASDKRAALNEAGARLGWGDLGSHELLDVWCPAWAEMWASKPTTPAPRWTRIAGEGQAFTATGLVRYGADTRWLQKTVAGAAQCTNGFFGGDPAVGTVKSCEAQMLATPPAEVWWVPKAASNANPPKTAPVYAFTPPSTRGLVVGRVAEYTTCGALAYVSGSTTYRHVTGGIAVCVRKP